MCAHCVCAICNYIYVMYDVLGIPHMSDNSNDADDEWWMVNGDWWMMTD